MTAADIIDAAVDYAPETAMPARFETHDGTRYTLDPEAAPYVYEGALVIPIVAEEEIS